MIAPVLYNIYAALSPLKGHIVPPQQKIPTLQNSFAKIKIRNCYTRKVNQKELVVLLNTLSATTSYLYHAKNWYPQTVLFGFFIFSQF